MDTELQQALLASFPGVPTLMTLNDLEPPKIWVLSDLFAILGCDAHL